VQSNFMELNDDTIYDMSQDGFYRRYRIVAPSITRHCFLSDELPGKTDFQSILLPSGDLYARRFPFQLSLSLSLSLPLPLLSLLARKLIADL